MSDLAAILFIDLSELKNTAQGKLCMAISLKIAQHT
jgi:hypothetical protein